MFMLNDGVLIPEKTRQQARAVLETGITDLIVNPRVGIGNHLDDPYANAFGAIIESAREVSSERPSDPTRKVWFTEKN